MKESLERRRDPYEQYFKNPERVETAGGTAEVVDIIPQHQKDEVPVLFAPAWACTIPVYEPALKTLAEQGRRTLSLNHPRRGGEMILTEQQQELVKEFPEEEVRKALTIIDILEKKQVGQVDVIAHSEGAINTAIAALLRPDLFRNFVFFGPAGLIGEDEVGRLAKGFASQGAPKPSLAEMPVSDADKAAARAEGRVAIEYPAISMDESVKSAIAKSPIEGVKYMAGNPIRSFREGWGMSDVQIDGLIAKLRERGAGVVIMSAVDDPVFPTERMMARLKKGSIDGFLPVRGGHGQIGENPERYMVAANQMLENLRDKKKRTTAGTSGER